jgi:hypothetical protein
MPPELTPMKKAVAEANTRIRALEAESGAKPGPEATSLNWACERLSFLEKALKQKNDTESEI